MSLIVNFFGGPGIGKSTQSAHLFTKMKKNHMDVELTFEFPKIVAWEENYSAIRDQFYITANQHRNISRLYGKVKYIIVDSPIILGISKNLKRLTWKLKNDWWLTIYLLLNLLWVLTLLKIYLVI